MTEDFLRPEITVVRRFVWNRAIEADGVCVWMDDTFPVHGERYILAARLIKRLRTGEPIGILVLLINSSTIVKSISTFEFTTIEIQLYR